MSRHILLSRQRKVCYRQGGCQQLLPSQGRIAAVPCQVIIIAAPQLAAGVVAGVIMVLSQCHSHRQYHRRNHHHHHFQHLQHHHTDLEMTIADEGSHKITLPIKHQ